MHHVSSGAAILAMLSTFPLVFAGLLPQRPDDQMMYVTYMFGFPAAISYPHAGVALLFMGSMCALVVLLGSDVFKPRCVTARAGRAVLRHGPFHS